jgi:hypothetical protein
VVLAASWLGLAAQAQNALPANKVFRFVPHANLAVLDPIWTTAYVTRNHAYMVYDTLFSEDAKGDIQPQMVQSYSTAKDGKTWTFKLRPGLEFHDGKPVTSEDVAASLKRWASRDAMGGILFGFIDKIETPDASTFRFVMKEPCAIVLDALGKASSNVPFIMPARIAAVQAILAEIPDEHVLLWHDLEDERRAIEKAVPGVVSVYGQQRASPRARHWFGFVVFPHASTSIKSTPTGTLRCLDSGAKWFDSPRAFIA